MQLKMISIVRMTKMMIEIIRKPKMVIEIIRMTKMMIDKIKKPKMVIEIIRMTKMIIDFIITYCYPMISAPINDVSYCFRCNCCRYDLSKLFLPACLTNGRKI